ncbi:type IV-A pilus assembly ATPase PilB [bacterium]|nr:type IV-A pilus assembly ATPase PilB [candidate division CSSED10-310 bacterium]
MTERLGDILIREGLITSEQLAVALKYQANNGGRLGSAIVHLKYLNEEDITEVLSNQFGVPSVNLNSFDIEESVLKLIPAEVARKYMLIPISRTGASLTIAMADPSNVFAQDDLKFMTGYHVEPVVASEMSIKSAIERYYGTGKAISVASTELDTRDTVTAGYMDDFADFDGGGGGGGESEEEMDASFINVDDFDDLVSGAVDELEVVDEDDEETVVAVENLEAPIVKLVNGILIKAINMGVSDIHFEPYEKSFRVRNRLDGVLRKELGLPLKIKDAVTSRLKIMANLDISERRLPQDGRIKMRLGPKREMDFRVSTLPTLFGEKIVLRLLDKANLQTDMTQLGFNERQLAEFQEAIHKPYGMCLVTGPTGSGKTTTLYSALTQLNSISDNIMTAEDPVEYNLMGINQVQMHDAIGLNFAAALRSFLRQDPDIIMVGEIRDFETAEIAIKAALTGHLVLSTIHTNDAPTTINRLLNMGVEPFLVASSLISIVAQRLARTVCKKCAEPVQVPPEALLQIGFRDEEIGTFDVVKGRGCPYCSHTGYKGRVALFEVLSITDEIRELILRGASAMEIRETAVALGMQTLRGSGLDKIREGRTTLEEVVRVTFGN